MIWLVGLKNDVIPRSEHIEIGLLPRKSVPIIFSKGSLNFYRGCFKFLKFCWGQKLFVEVQAVKWNFDRGFWTFHRGFWTFHRGSPLVYFSTGAGGALSWDAIRNNKKRKTQILGMETFSYKPREAFKYIFGLIPFWNVFTNFLPPCGWPGLWDYRWVPFLAIWKQTNTKMRTKWERNEN